MRRITTLIAVLLLVFVPVLAACTGNAQTAAGTETLVYGLSSAEQTVIEPQALLCPPEGDPIRFVADSALSVLWSAGLSGTPVSLEDYWFSDGIVTLALTAPYAILGGYDRTVADACLVLTLTAIEGVEGVILTAGGEIGQATPVTLRRDDFLLGLPDTTLLGSGSTRFFSDAQGRYAVPESRTMVLREDEAVERYLMLDLIAGPKKEGLLPVIPEGTRLLDVVTADRICAVDLSREFIDNAKGGLSAARMTLCCIVGTLTSLSHVEGVTLYVEGEPLTDYFGLDCTPSLTADPYIQTPAAHLGAYDLSFFYPDSLGGLLYAIPITISAPDRSALAEAAVSLLCHGEPPLGMAAALPEDARLQSVTETPWGYTVDFSAGFFRTEPPVSPEISLQAIVHLLNQVKKGAAVSFTQNGLPLTTYHGYTVPTRLYPQTDGILGVHNGA